MTRILGAAAVVVVALLAGGCVGLARPTWDSRPTDAGSPELGGDGLLVDAPPVDASQLDLLVDDVPQLDLPADIHAPDMAPPPDAKNCQPEDAITSCDPLAATGCPTGSACYIVKGKHLDCVCPPGTKALGASCNTATECAPGATCFSATSTPPGSCRALCDPKAPACTKGLSCKTINNFPGLGYCGS